MNSSQWMDEWMRAWQSLSSAGEAQPWSAAFDHFTRAHQAAFQQPVADAFARMSEQSRAFLELGQTMARHADQGWQQSVFTYLDELSDRLQDPQAATAGFGGASPLDYWRRFAGHDAQAPSDPKAFTSQLDQLLRMPGLGPTREHEEAVQTLSRLWLAYQAAYNEYAAYCTETARRSVARLRERLTEAFNEGAGPDSLRGLFDAWVACSEEVYAERTASDEYVRLHGRLVNTFMAYRQQAGRLLDQWAQAADLPSRQELDALHRKLKETRQALRALEARAGSGKKARG